MSASSQPALSFGDLTLKRAIDMDPFRLPFSLIFPGADLTGMPEALGDLAASHLDMAAGDVLLAVQSHIVEVGGKTILIDTCVGEHKPRPRRAEWHQRRATGYLAALASAGYAPDDIDIVLCSHLHVDHVGWNTMLRDGRWVPTFPRARYAIGASELAYWQDEIGRNPEASHGCFIDSVRPVVEAGQVSPCEIGQSLADGARIIPLPGHTPGQVGIELTAAGGERVIVCGDAIHSPVQVVRPDWSSGFCSDPAQATATRMALLATAADEDVVLVPNHLRGPGLRIRRSADGGFRPHLCGCGG